MVVQILLPCIELPAKSGIGPVEQAGTFCIDVTCGSQNCELLEGGTTTLCKAFVLTGSVVVVDPPIIVGAFTSFLPAAADSFSLNVSTVQTSGKKYISELFLCPLKIKVYVHIYLFNIDVHIYFY